MTKNKKEKIKKKLTVEYIKDAISLVSQKANIHPQQITLNQLLEFDEELTEWNLRKFGGLSVLKSGFPIEKDLVSIKKTKEITAYIKQLETKLANKQDLIQDIQKSIISNIKPVKITPYTIKDKTLKQTRHNVAMLNDTHIGLKVAKKEVDGLNEFDFLIASRRIAFFIDEVCKFKQEKRDEVETLHLLLNGDLIAGIIHGLMGDDLHLLTHQFNGAVHIFTNAIAHCSKYYKNVNVYFSTGNHGDSPHRREGSRVLSQIYDSIEGQIFYAISAAHKNTKNVKFHAGHTLYQDFQLPAGRAAMTHGHLMFSNALGNPGTTVNTKLLGTAVSDFNVSQLRLSREEVQLWLLGHTHCHFHVTTKSGVQIYNAPSLSGLDSYAYSIGVQQNLTAQVVFESTEKYIMGDVRLIHVQEADKNPEYDKIISPYNLELVYNE
jgi:hypothetical protein